MFNWVVLFSNNRLLFKCPRCGFMYVGASGPYHDAPWYYCSVCGFKNSDELIVPPIADLRFDYQLCLFDL